MQEDETIDKYSDRISSLFNNIDCLVVIFQIKRLWRNFLLLFLGGLNPESQSKDLNIISLGELMSVVKEQA